MCKNNKFIIKSNFKLRPPMAELNVTQYYYCSFFVPIFLGLIPIVIKENKNFNNNDLLYLLSVLDVLIYNKSITLDNTNKFQNTKNMKNTKY